MRITPRYDGPEVIALARSPEVGEAFVRQRRRLEALFASLDDDEWGTPSRCEDWTVQDVASHLAIVNGFFHGAIAAGLAGEPTRLLIGFDPKATPAAMVEDVREASPAETFARYVKSNDELCGLVGGLDDEQLATIAEVPAGHLPIHIAVSHGLWDAWVHERDVAIPLGRTPTEDADELAASLRFVAALGPAAALGLGLASTPAVLVLESTDPDCRLAIEVTDRVVVNEAPAPDADTDATLVLHDSAINLLEVLSVRAPLPPSVPDEHRWLVNTLGTIFETR